MTMKTEYEIGNGSFQTTDMSLASTISLFRPVEAIDRSEGSAKANFVFIHDSELDGLIDRFWRGELQVEPRRYFEALRSIKARLYE